MVKRAVGLKRLKKMPIKELLSEPIVLHGEPPAKTNITIDYKLKNVPYAKISNKSLRYSKKRWESAMSTKDAWVMIMRIFKNQNSIETIKNHVFICAEFHLTSSKEGVFTKRKDLDNCLKLFLDAIVAAELILDDSQIVAIHTFKKPTTTKPKIIIHSIASSDHLSDQVGWTKFISTIL